MLHGRKAERASIDALLADARATRGGVLVLHGLPGVGKSALLDYAIENAEGMRILRTQGVESESPLAFAALHRLLRPLRQLLERLPARQAHALRAAFGEEDDPRIDRFVVFLAVLSVLAEAAEEAPVLAVIDDAHWLDDASAAALTFVARRVQAERIALLFAARDGDVRQFEAPDLPAVAISGLAHDAAVQLLTEHAAGVVAATVAEELVTRTDGNPLALVELPGALTPAQLAGETPLPARLPVTDGIQRVFLDRAARLPVAARTLLLVAAADDAGDVAVIRGAAAMLGAGQDALDVAEESGLVRVRDGQLQMHHPLVRSALYGAAPSRVRADVHRALAAVDGQDPDRRAWHLAAAARAPDEQVAAELERVAERARRHGGQEAASAALERAADLTPTGDDRRARRLLDAALAAWLAGQPARAGAIAERASDVACSAKLGADIALLRARIEWNTGSVQVGHRMVLGAAADIAPVDPGRARELAMFAAALASVGGDSGLAVDPLSLVPPARPADSSRTRCIDALMRGLTAVGHGRWREASDDLRPAIAMAEAFVEADQDLLPNLGIAAMHLQDDDAVLHIHTLLLTRARDTGASIMILYALTRRVIAEIMTGRWGSARAASAEALDLAHATGRPGLAALPLAWTALLAGLQGEDVQSRLAEIEQIADSHPMGTTAGLVRDATLWIKACADAEDPAAPLHHLEQMTLPLVRHLAAIDRLDAAVRADRPDTATAWSEELEAFAAGTATDAVSAAAAHGRALVAAAAGSPDAAQHFEDALIHHEHSPRRVDAARTRLAYGEHLRRIRRRVDARQHLRAALAVFEDIGAHRWADRARQELRASGETARRRDRTDTSTLTPQELQVATLVAQGLSNRDVAAQLFVSPRTVDFHLRNIFGKLGITSRSELVRIDLANAS